MVGAVPAAGVARHQAVPADRRLLVLVPLHTPAATEVIVLVVQLLVLVPAAAVQQDLTVPVAEVRPLLAVHSLHLVDLRTQVVAGQAEEMELPVVPVLSGMRAMARAAAAAESTAVMAVLVGRMVEALPVARAAAAVPAHSLELKAS